MAGVREELEFDEGDVWDVLHGDHHQGSSAAAALVATPPGNKRASGGGKDKLKKAGAAAAERDGVVVSGCRPGKPRSMAPVAIPAAGSRGGGEGEEEEDGTEEEEDGVEMQMLPPHEWLARKMERMGVAVGSPPDQAGRQGRSKARALTRARDAVLSKTAFSDK